MRKILLIAFSSLILGCSLFTGTEDEFYIGFPPPTASISLAEEINTQLPSPSSGGIYDLLDKKDLVIHQQALILHRQKLLIQKLYSENLNQSKYTMDDSIEALLESIAVAKADLASMATITEMQTATTWTPQDVMTISSVVLMFGLIVFFLLTYLIKSGKETEPLLKLFGIVLIIIAAVFLMVAGYSDKQVAPVIGLLGTIAGYLLGKSSHKG